jgi:glycosyltransferase involved in cell wall biosynthesis
VEVLVPREHSDTSAARADGIRVHVLPPARAPWPRALRAFRHVEDISALAHLLRARPFDVVHLNLASARLHGRFAALLSGRPVVVSTIRGLDCRYERLSNALDDRTVAVSSTVREFLVERGIPARRIEVIPNALDLADIDRAPHDTTYLHRELGIATQTRLIGMVAYFRSHPLKGHHVFLDAARIVAAARTDVAFVLVGSNLASTGHCRERCERYAAELGIATRVHFLGERDDVPAIMSSLAAHVLPSFQEGCPMTVLEAMARGTVSIASDIPSVREIVSSGEDGLLFETGDAAALGRAILSVLDDPVQARAWTKRARQRVERDHGGDIMARRYEELFFRLCAARGHRLEARWA